MEDITYQGLSFASMVLVPFIPNVILRYIMLAFAPLLFVARLVHHNMPHRQVERLGSSVEDVVQLFSKAVDECARDPRFLCETGLKLTEINYALSTLRARTISLEYIAWKAYPYHLIAIGSGIDGCRRDMENLRSSILLAVERARQQVFQEDIDHRRATLTNAFPGALWQQSLTQRQSWRRIRCPSGEQLYLSNSV
ncbi:hypothetical protein C8F04DRAFT_1109746 [Mycena alexandri]|uniref:Uncharacterized protein n=1 Tax=Mycena alexandri TaxID=1745969 RepID=A0AAD6SP69_9AGAR|nr:hypothetical protein C8F04DRAFT_1109746 [Mycena alexandri]